MSIRAHLSKMAATLGEHFAHVAQCLKSDMEACENTEDRAAFRGLLDRHTQTAEACAECAKALGKSDADGELDKAMPLPAGLSRVAPTNPTRLTAVPRPGSPELAKQQIAEDLQEITGI
jgi:hypothetical protein